MAYKIKIGNITYGLKANNWERAEQEAKEFDVPEVATPVRPEFITFQSVPTDLWERICSLNEAINGKGTRTIVCDDGSWTDFSNQKSYGYNRLRMQLDSALSDLSAVRANAPRLLLEAQTLCPEAQEILQSYCMTTNSMPSYF